MNQGSNKDRQAGSPFTMGKLSLRDVAKLIVYFLPHVLASRLVLRAALFFLLSFGVIAGLVFAAGFPRVLLWVFALPLFLVCVGLSFCISLRSVPAEPQSPHIYDKAKFHDAVPEDVSPEQAFVYVGMFVGWLIERNMISAEFLEDTRGFKERKVTGARVYEAWDGCLASDELTDEGNRFTVDYFESSNYLDDYMETLVKNLPSIYHVPDTWENYDAIKKKIDERYQTWKKREA